MATDQRRRMVSDRVRGRSHHLVDSMMNGIELDGDGSHSAEVPIDNLWLDDQPRQIVPEDVLARLIAEGRAQPAILLEELSVAAAKDPYFAEVKAQIDELAANIRVNGVLTPILVARKGDRWVVRDGHRRSLASLVAERATIPYHVVDEPSEFVAMGRQFAANAVRVDFTAIDQARWLLRMAREAEAGIRTELGLTEGDSVVDVLVGQGDPDGVDDEGERSWRNLSAPERDLLRRIREDVCRVTGLGDRAYLQLLALNKLTPEARAAGRRLTEGQLRPIAGLAPDFQVRVAGFIAEQKLGSREAVTLAKVVRTGDQDAVQRVMQRLAREDISRRRVSVSFESLLHAIPEDYPARCAALHAELQALSDDLRQVRLRTMREQCHRARELAREFEEMLELFDSTGGATPS